MTKKSSFNFEAALNDLHDIVEQMEAGNLGLEQSLKTFEKGINLTRQCQKALKEADQQVKILLEKNNETLLDDFQEGSAESDDRTSK